MFRTRPEPADKAVRSSLLAEDRLQRVQVVARGELLESFPGVPALQISRQHFFQRRLQLLKRDAAENLPAHGLVVTEAAADADVIAFQRLAGDFHLRAEQPDVAHVMLRAGIWAAGQMDVERLIEFELFLQVVRQFQRVRLGVRGTAQACAGENAAGLSEAPGSGRDVSGFHQAA